MMNWTIYSPSSGEIQGTFSGREEDALLNGEAILAGHYSGSLFYVDDVEPQPRPSFELDVVSDTVAPLEVYRVDNIPEGTTVTFPNGASVVDDGFIEWSTTVPGVYVFRFSNFPFKDETLHVTVNDV